jgi:hypothetical protein
MEVLGTDNLTASCKVLPAGTCACAGHRYCMWYIALWLTKRSLVNGKFLRMRDGVSLRLFCLADSLGEQMYVCTDVK